MDPGGRPGIAQAPVPFRDSAQIETSERLRQSDRTGPGRVHGDDLRRDLGAAEARLDAAEPRKLTIAAKSSGLVLTPVKAGFIWSA